MVTLADCLTRRDNALAAVRILAAVAVLHAHAWIVTTPDVETEDFFHIFAFSLDFHGVHAFFILSGLLLTRSLMERPDVLRFTIARLTRYVPGILAAALFAALVVGPLTTTLPLGDYFGSGRPLAFVAAVTTLYDVNAALPGVFETRPEPGTLFVPLWTIHYELVFAIALGLLWALGLMRVRWLVLAGLIGTLGVAFLWFWDGESHLRMGTPHHLVRFCTAFGIGIAMAVFADRIPVSNRIMLALIAICAPLAYSHVAALAGFALIAYGMLCIGFKGGPVAAGLARLGVWSYGFYVWGFLIEQTVANAFPSWSISAVFAASLVLALAAGALSWRFVEAPAIARTGHITAAIRRLVRRERPEAAE